MTGFPGRSPVPLLLSPFRSPVSEARKVVLGFPRRVREKQFLLIQTVVLSVAALHWTLEKANFWEHHGLNSAIPHVPLVLYIGPIVYAGFRYGFEGGLLTGLWSTLLSIPNLLTFHRGGYVWVGELSFLLVVSATGVLVALPVERERQQRTRAEISGRRLRLLNEITGTLAGATDLGPALKRVASRLAEVMGLDGAAIVTGDVGTPFARSGDTRDIDRLIGTLDPSTLHDGSFGGPITTDKATLVTFTARDRLGGYVAAIGKAHQPLEAEETAILSAVAGQVGIAVEAESLRAQERARLYSYVRQVTRAQEEERKRIARELHDETAQGLVLLCRKLDELAAADRGFPIRRGVQQLRPLAQDSLASLRRFSRNLRPPILDDLGLLPALEALTDELGANTGMDARVFLDGVPRRLPSETELTLFRITQEALHNVERHARAKHVRVEISFGEESISLRIADDGAGFDVPESLDHFVPAGRLGLVGIRERAELIGATLAIDSRPDLGTTISTALGIGHR